MGKRIRFAGSSARDDKQWLITTVLNGATLFGVERSQIRLGHWFQIRIIDHISKQWQGALSQFESVICATRFRSSRHLPTVRPRRLRLQ
jgi:hypothetical protein